MKVHSDFPCSQFIPMLRCWGGKKQHKIYISPSAHSWTFRDQSTTAAAAPHEVCIAVVVFLIELTAQGWYFLQPNASLHIMGISWSTQPCMCFIVKWFKNGPDGCWQLYFLHESVIMLSVLTVAECPLREPAWQRHRTLFACLYWLRFKGPCDTDRKGLCPPIHHHHHHWIHLLWEAGCDSP